MSIHLEPAGWGLAGAFIYAAPRLSACLFSGHRSGGPGRCLFEFGLALSIGAVAAAVFGPWLQDLLGRAGHKDLNAICALIGLMANPAAPRIVDALGGLAVGALNGTLWKALSSKEPKR